MTALKGYTVPQTPRGTSSLAPPPPWHYICTALFIEFEADPVKAAAFLPEGLERGTGKCSAFFAEWQAATDGGDEYLDPVRSQYNECFFLVSGMFEGAAVQYCPFIFVNQDTSLMRGLIQGLPKQFGSVWLTRASVFDSPAAPRVAPGGRFGATLSVKERRVAEALVTLREPASSGPSLSNVINVRHFPTFIPGRYESPAVHELVRMKPRNVQAANVWKGDASLTIFDNPYLEVADLRPTRVTAGYRFDFGFTLDESLPIRDLRKG